MKTETWNPLLSETELLQPLSRKKETMYVLDLDVDLFENAFSQIDHVLAVIALCPQHTFQIATKNAERMEAYFAEEYKCSGNRYVFEIRKILTRHHRINKAFMDSLEFPLHNLWLGVQIENQEQADAQIPFLLETPAAVRFVICEPLLGQIDFINVKELNDGSLDFRYHNYLNGFVQTTTNSVITEFDVSYYLDAKIDWVIVSGANGKNAQPTHPDWVRSIKDQCKAANVPFYFKGWGEWLPVEKINGTWYNNGGAPTLTLGYLADQYYLDDSNYAAKVGKEKSGCLLDGVEYKELPK